MRAQIEAVSDHRLRPRIKTHTALSGILVMALAQLGSLNALEETTKYNSFRHRWIGDKLPSADTIGNVAEKINSDCVRKLIKHVYSKLKRNKAITPFLAGKITLVVDGHESSSSYHIHCPGCLEREINTLKGERTQYYHRHVMAQLVCEDFRLDRKSVV